MTTGADSPVRSLPVLARGKVRDLYAVDEAHVLIVASDRLSAFDVPMARGIPGKGVLLTRMSNFWFGLLAPLCPHHLTGIAPEAVVREDERAAVAGRAVVARRLEPVRIEAVVRGYLAGSGWDAYRRNGSVCGVRLPAGLQQASRLPEPVFTPVEKAPAGSHDRNIDYAEMCALVGESVAARIRDASLALYAAAAAHALERGVIVADTKFEFGLDVQGTLVLMDEVLTPDSSRFWPVETWREGTQPPGYDKQYLRDWLEALRLGGRPWNKQPPAPALPDDVIERTAAVYRQAFERLTGPKAAR